MLNRHILDSIAQFTHVNPVMRYIDLGLVHGSLPQLVTLDDATICYIDMKELVLSYYGTPDEAHEYFHGAEPVNSNLLSQAESESDLG